MIQLPINGASKIIIVGNGFDINLELKTQYSQFMQSDYYLEFSGKSKLLADFLRHGLSKNLGRWVDIEMELANFSKSDVNDLSIDQLNEHFKSLKTSLCKYLADQEKAEINISDSMKKFIENEIVQYKDKRGTLIINFNYTNTFNRVLKQFDLIGDNVARRDVNKIGENHIINIHHTLMNPEKIIFGVHTDAQIQMDHDFLRKGSHLHYHGININELLVKASHISSFGYSFGLTDQSYFKDFFTYCVKYRPGQKGVEFMGAFEDKRHINTYHYDESDYQKFNQRLNEMTELRSDIFKQNNIFNPTIIKPTI